MKDKTLVDLGMEEKYCFRCRTTTWFTLYDVFDINWEKQGQVWQCQWCNWNWKPQAPATKESLAV